MYEQTEARDAYLQQGKKEGYNAAVEQCASILLGERGRLGKLQLKEYSGTRSAQMDKLHSMANRLRKLKK